MKEINKFSLLGFTFLFIYFFPLEWIPFKGPFFESIALLQWYAREHVLLCLIPALFIAGAIYVFLNQASVMRYFGPDANKFLAYGVASVSGTILAVCSCTILPIFSGIHKKGAGIGPAIAFLYAGPAINILAIILTARILGFELGLARAIGAIIFSIIIGLLMHLFFLKEEKNRVTDKGMFSAQVDTARPLWKNSLYFLTMIIILVFANFGKPRAGVAGLWQHLFELKWWIAGVFLLLFFYMVFAWFQKGERSDWLDSTWDFTKQILPLLFVGVLIAGFLLGRPDSEGLIPSGWIASFVGGNSVLSNFLASIVGAFMYFATLTEVPILEALIGAGMGKGPALALLLAGPALSLPNMLVIRNILGTKKTIVYITLVVIMGTLSGIIYGSLF